MFGVLAIGRADLAGSRPSASREALLVVGYSAWDMKKPSWLVAIGTSAGGLDALARLLPQLAPDFPGAILIAQHMPADVTGEATLRALRKVATLECSQARDGEPLKAGHVYLAPSDQHMMVKKTSIMVTKGARENGWRPAIDPLFRSVAVAHGNRSIGVVLTGYLDDGTAGLVAIKRCGGSASCRIRATPRIRTCRRTRSPK